MRLLALVLLLLAPLGSGRAAEGQAPPAAPGGAQRNAQDGVKSGAAGGGSTVSFQVSDERDPAEVSEDTVIFIGGQQVAHFILDPQHDSETQTITVPAAAQYDYAMCGRITILRDDGSHEQHVVDGGATLKGVNGGQYRALAANDFTIFYIAAANDPAPVPPADAHHTNACSLPVV